MRRLRWVSGIVWVFNWYTIDLEIIRWHHMTKSLRFSAPPPVAGRNGRFRAGMPLKAVCVRSVDAPLAFVTATIAGRVAAGRRQGLPRAADKAKGFAGAVRGRTVSMARSVEAAVGRERLGGLAWCLPAIAGMRAGSPLAWWW
jgi:hypothetical protein